MSFAMVIGVPVDFSLISSTDSNRITREMFDQVSKEERRTDAFRDDFRRSILTPTEIAQRYTHPDLRKNFFQIYEGAEHLFVMGEKFAEIYPTNLELWQKFHSDWALNNKIYTYDDLLYYADYANAPVALPAKDDQLYDRYVIGSQSALYQLNVKGIDVDEVAENVDYTTPFSSILEPYQAGTPNLYIVPWGF